MTCQEEDIVRQFTKLFHQSDSWSQTNWRGVPIRKYPTDLIVYQEIIWGTMPEAIVETGTDGGGSALFFHDMMAMYSQVALMITVDVIARPASLPPFIQSIQSNSISRAAIDRVAWMTAGKRTMVVLDSDHQADHVFDEMEAYAPLVSPGCYLVVEDGVAPHVMPQCGLNPQDAIDRFLPNHPEFKVDESRGKFLLTSNPGGYLRRQ